MHRTWVWTWKPSVASCFTAIQRIDPHKTRTSLRANLTPSTGTILAAVSAMHTAMNRHMESINGERSMTGKTTAGMRRNLPGRATP